MGAGKVVNWGKTPQPPRAGSGVGMQQAGLMQNQPNFSGMGQNSGIFSPLRGVAGRGEISQMMGNLGNALQADQGRQVDAFSNTVKGELAKRGINEDPTGADILATNLGNFQTQLASNYASQVLPVGVEMAKLAQEKTLQDSANQNALAQIRATMQAEIDKEKALVPVNLDAFRQSTELYNRLYGSKGGATPFDGLPGTAPYSMDALNADDLSGGVQSYDEYLAKRKKTQQQQESNLQGMRDRSAAAYENSKPGQAHQKNVGIANQAINWANTISPSGVTTGFSPNGPSAATWKPPAAAAQSAPLPGQQAQQAGQDANKFLTTSRY